MFLNVYNFRLHHYLLVPLVNERPRLADLQNYITPHYASHWEKIGIGLGLPEEGITIIEEDYHRCEKQCNVLLSYWLQAEESNATWKKLLTVLDSPAVIGSQRNHNQFKTGM